MDFHPIRQYHSASIARSFLLKSGFEIPGINSEVLIESSPKIIEPPFIEVMAVCAYKLIGQDAIWIPRIFSILFWLIGAAFLYRLTKSQLDTPSALLCLSYVLFLPFTIISSRSFQPEPFMVMLVIAGLYCMILYFNRSTIKNLIICSVVCGLAVLQKPNAAFIILGAFACIGINKWGLRRFIFNHHSLIFCLIAFLPAFSYYTYHLFLSKKLSNQMGIQHISGLYFQSLYWTGWLKMVLVITGIIPLFAAIFGLFAMQRGILKSLCTGAFLGYFIMGLFFNYAIFTHSYYHMILLPWVGICFAHGIVFIFNKYLFFLRKPKNLLLATLGLTVLGGVFIIWKRPSVKTIIGKKKSQVITLAKWTCGHPKLEYWLLPDDSIIPMAQEVGQAVQHSQAVFFIADHPEVLKYHGYMDGVTWPLHVSLRDQLSGQAGTSCGPEETYEYLSQIKSPEYIVITNYQSMKDQTSLMTFLQSNFTLYKQTKNYMIYTPAP